MTPVTLPRLLATVAIGLTYYWVTASAWGLLAVNNPVNDFLLDAFVRHERHLIAYRLAIYAHDVLVNLLLALPFAAAFRFLPTLHSWIYVALAAATAVIAIYAPTDWEAAPSLFLSWIFWVGVAMAALSLPITFALLNRVRWDSPSSPIAHDAA